MSLVSTLADIWKRFQGELFPELAEEVGELHTKHRRLVAILDMVPVEGFVGVRNGGGNGRPVEDRAALARAFIAKAVWDFPTTRELMDRIASHATLCCAGCAGGRGWAGYRAKRRFRGPLGSSRGAGCRSGCTRRW